MARGKAKAPRTEPTGAPKAEAAPPAEKIAIPSPWIDRDPTMMGNALTPKVLTNILFRRNEGYMQQWVDLADEAREKDPHLHSQLSLREQSVVETDYDVLPGAGSNQQRAKKAAAAWKERLDEWKTRPNAGIEQWLAEITGSAYYGRGAHEIIWQFDGGEIVPTDLEKLDTRRLSYACDQADPDPWVMRIWDENDPRGMFGGRYGVPITEFHPDKFLVNEVRVRGAQKTREGLFATVVWYWLFRVWSWRDVMALTEMIGRPPIIGYFSAGGAKADENKKALNGERNASDKEVLALKKAVHGITGSLRAMLADTTRIEPMVFDVPGGDTPLQLAISKAVDAFESKAINGVDSVSDLKPGARASVEVQERATATFWRSDCRRVDRLLSWLGARYIAANPQRFGENCPPPIVKMKTDPPRDLVSAGQRISTARANGIAVPKKWAYGELQIPEPQQGEEVLAPIAAPATPNPNDPKAADAKAKTPPTDPPADSKATE
jgi:phage gp29-like protein